MGAGWGYMPQIGKSVRFTPYRSYKHSETAAKKNSEMNIKGNLQSRNYDATFCHKATIICLKF